MKQNGSGCMKVFVYLIIIGILITFIQSVPLFAIALFLLSCLDRWLVKNKLVPKSYFKKYQTIKDLEKEQEKVKKN